MITAKLQINSTQIPNYLIDEVMPLVSPTEFKILMIIARQTYGWHKEADRISYTLLISKTGSSNGAIATSLRTLREKGFIQVTNEDGKEIKTKDEARGQDLYYRVNVTYPKIGDDLSRNRTPKIGDTKETNTKDISIINNTNMVAKPPKYSEKTNFRNPFVHQILEAHKELTQLSRPTDRLPDREAWSFHRRYGADNFYPALEYFQSIWKKVELTSIAVVTKNYPIYQRDVLKTGAPSHEMTEDEKFLDQMGRQT